MKKIVLSIPVLIACILLCGCSSYAFTMDSDPEEAEIRIINDKGETVYSGKTPATVPSKYIPKGDYTIVLSKEGYEDNIALKGNQKTLKLNKMNLGKRPLKKIDPK